MTSSQEEVGSRSERRGQSVLIDIDLFSSNEKPAFKPDARLAARFTNRRTGATGSKEASAALSASNENTLMEREGNLSSARSDTSGLTARSSALTGRSDRTSSTAVSSTAKKLFLLSDDEDQYIEQFFSSKDLNVDIAGFKPNEMVSALKSRQFQEREQAAKALTNWIGKSSDLPQGFMIVPFLLLPMDKTKVLQAYCLAIRKLLHDKVMKVFTETNILLRALTNSPAVKSKRREEVASYFEKIISMLVSKSADINVRVRRDVTRSLIRIASIPYIQVNTMIFRHLTEDIAARATPKIWAGRLEMLRMIITKCKIKPEGKIALEKTAVMKFLNTALHNTNGTSRKIVISVIIEIQRQKGRDETIRLLGTVKPALISHINDTIASQEEVQYESLEENNGSTTTVTVNFVQSVITKELIAKTSLQGASMKATKTPLSFGEQLNMLTHLNLNDCGIDSIDNIHYCPNLRVLYLYNNRISVISGLEKLSKITHLYLQNNRIRDLNGLANLRQLTKLYLDSNRIRIVQGLGNMRCLEELYISFQDLSADEHMTFETDSMLALKKSLVILHASGNRIQELAPLAELANVRTMNLSRNLVMAFGQSGTDKMLRQCTSLEELHLTENPICSHKKYRPTVTFLASEALTDLDSVKILENQRIFAKRVMGSKLAQGIRIEKAHEGTRALHAIESSRFRTF